MDHLNATLPPLLTQLRLFVAAILAFLRSGCKLAPLRKRQFRKQVCDICTFRSHRRCKLCGCFLPLKRALAVSECPDNRWVASDTLYLHTHNFQQNHHDKVTDEQYCERIEKCVSCKHRIISNGTIYCTGCEEICLVQYKAMWTNQDCPLKLWPTR